MCRWLRTLLAGALIIAVAPAALADDDDDDEGGTYLALGDSVAAGTQVLDPFTDNGYTNRLFKHLKEEYGFDDFENLACPGDDTVEMRLGIGGGSPFGSLCYGPFAQLPPFGTSQLDAAVAYLLANPGEVRLITIAIGANDLLTCNPLELPPDQLQACVAGQLGQIGANLPVIVGTLKAVAPGVPIVAMNYYNPNLAFWLAGPAGQDLATQSLALTAAFNGTLLAVYEAFGVPVADVETTFKTFKTKGGDPPKNVRATCRLTLMCEKSGSNFVLSDFDPSTPEPDPDIHPTNKGYKKIAATHAELIDELDTFD